MGKFHLIESQLNTLSEKNQSLENQIDEKERTIQDNSRLMLNYQKEVRNFIFTQKIIREKKSIRNKISIQDFEAVEQRKRAGICFDADLCRKR